MVKHINNLEWLNTLIFRGFLEFIGNTGNLLHAEFIASLTFVLLLNEKLLQLIEWPLYVNNFKITETSYEMQNKDYQRALLNLLIITSKLFLIEISLNIFLLIFLRMKEMYRKFNLGSLGQHCDINNTFEMADEITLKIR